MAIHFVNVNLKLNKLKKTLYFTIGLVIVISLSVGIYNRYFNIYETLKIGSEIEVMANKISKNRGVIVINDSFALVGAATYQIKDSTAMVTNITNTKNRSFKPSLYYVQGPYRIVKKAFSDTLLIIKNSDTMYFKFSDPDKKDPFDPTFSDIYERFRNRKK